MIVNDSDDKNSEKKIVKETKKKKTAVDMTRVIMKMNR